VGEGFYQGDLVAFMVMLVSLTGYWLLVTGYWLLVTGYWLLVAGALCRVRTPGGAAGGLAPLRGTFGSGIWPFGPDRSRRPCLHQS